MMDGLSIDSNPHNIHITFYKLKIIQFMKKQSIDKVYSTSDHSLSGNIFIGNLEAALSLQTLKTYNIKAVVTVAKGCKLPHSNLQLPDYLYIPAIDHPNFDLGTYFSQSSAFIAKCLTYTNILVHCVAGISRSSTIVIAYIMKMLQKSWIQVCQMVKSKREVVSPNHGFKLQLKFYQVLLKQARMSKWIRAKLANSQSKRILKTEVSQKSQKQKKQFNIQQNQKLQSKLKGQSMDSKQLSPRRMQKYFKDANSGELLCRRRSNSAKFSGKNLKLSSERKCFQKMVLSNQQKIKEKLCKILTITNI